MSTKMFPLDSSGKILKSKEKYLCAFCYQVHVAYVAGIRLKKGGHYLS